jgi:arsenite methyltransferase
VRTTAQKTFAVPVDYDPRYLEVIPAEVVERDYGCGYPSRYLREGETVLGLGSGTGKICFIASSIWLSTQHRAQSPSPVDRAN